MIAGEIKRATAPGPAVDGTSAIHLALAAMLAVRRGGSVLARKALDASRSLALDHGYYDRAVLWHTADCETQFVDAPKDQIACLAKLVDGREYFQTHVALMLAYQAHGDKTDANTQSQWLTAHRGQAIAELENEPALIPNLLSLRKITTGGAQGNKSIPPPASESGIPKASARG